MERRRFPDDEPHANSGSGLAATGEDDGGLRRYLPVVVELPVANGMQDIRDRFSVPLKMCSSRKPTPVMHAHHNSAWVWPTPSSRWKRACDRIEASLAANGRGAWQRAAGVFIAAAETAWLGARY